MSSGVSRKLVSLSKLRCRSIPSNENKWISLTNSTGRAAELSIDRRLLYLCAEELDKRITKAISVSYYLSCRCLVYARLSLLDNAYSLNTSGKSHQNSKGHNYFYSSHWKVSRRAITHKRSWNIFRRMSFVLRRSECLDQPVTVKGPEIWSLINSLRPYSRFSRPEPLIFISSSSLIVLTRLWGPRSRPTTSQKIWYCR
jgi:hypothetical protein